MSWIDLLIDSRAIRAIYGEQVPSLEGVDLHRVRLDRRGGAIFLDFDLTEFPAVPPKKWRAQEVNTVQVELEFFEVVTLKLDGWNIDSRVNLGISRSSAGLIELVCSEVPKLHVTAEWVALRKISAYQSALR